MKSDGLGGKSGGLRGQDGKSRVKLSIEDNGQVLAACC